VTTLTAEAAAAEGRVRELEDKLKALETERAAAEARAAEDAKKKVESQAAARGQTVDPAALQKAQDEARKKAQAEQERRQQEEKTRLEEEQRAAEARLAEERRRADEEARLAAAAATTTLPAPPPSTAAPAPALRAGTLVNLSDPGVMPPVMEREGKLVYPPIAQRQGLTGVVELNVLIDERGNVTDTQIVAGTGGRSGMNEAAIVCVKQRKYRPATKDGVPVKVWYPVRVQFVLQPR
jgi:TonB family protein